MTGTSAGVTGPERPARIVDAHVHHWDPARPDWYPFLATPEILEDLGMGDPSGMVRRFGPEEYAEETREWPIEKIVHVAASALPSEETSWLGRLAASDGRPQAIIGTVNPALPIKRIERSLDGQAEVRAFRGIRILAGTPGPDGLPLPYDGPAHMAILALLEDRQMVYDLSVHPAGMAAAANAIGRFPELTVVVEHTGWPQDVTSAAGWDQWSEGMRALADCSPGVHCKLSGLPMALHTFAPERIRPWIARSLEIFGADRCMFAGNFPPDSLYGGFGELYSTYVDLANELALDSLDALFAANAERVYRC